MIQRTNRKKIDIRCQVFKQRTAFRIFCSKSICAFDTGHKNIIRGERISDTDHLIDRTEINQLIEITND